MTRTPTLDGSTSSKQTPRPLSTASTYIAAKSIRKTSSPKGHQPSLSHLAIQLQDSIRDLEGITDLLQSDLPEERQKGEEKIELWLADKRNFDQKADNCLSYCDVLNGRANFYQSQIDRYKELLVADESKSERIKEAVIRVFNVLFNDQDVTSYDLPTHKLKSRMTESIDVNYDLVDLTQLPKEAIRTPEPKPQTVDKTSSILKSLLRQGQKFLGIQIIKTRKWRIQ